MSQEIGRDDSQEIPCEPRAVLQNVCQKCHARPAKNGAPFPLERRSDVFRTYGGEEIRELMIEEVTARRMPLTPVTIEDAQRETLLAWLKAGAPAVAATSCTDGGADGGEASDAASDADPDATDPGVDVDAGADQSAAIFDGGDDQ